MNTESSAGIIDAADQSKALINIPAHASSSTLAASFDVPVHPPFHVERLILPSILDMMNTNAAETGDSVGSSYISLGQNSQPFQTTLNEYQLARTTLLVGISTSSDLKAIPFYQVRTTAAFKAVVLDAWSLDAAMRGRIESVTIKYPWVSSRQIEFVLGDDEAYKHMQQQIMGSPCWWVENGFCAVEVDLVLKEEEKEEGMTCGCWMEESHEPAV